MLAAFLLLFVQDPPDPAQARAERPPAFSDAMDVSLSVRASARQVRWRQVGTVSLRAWSEPGGPVVERSLSTGLPRPIPGQRTFNNVGWTLDVGAAVTGPLPETLSTTPSASSQATDPR